LETALNDHAFFQKVSSSVETRALKILPESLPVGLGHGDFAMRNILVGSDERITVLDTYAKWRAPIYEDIGYFLSALKLSAPQVISQGLIFDRAQLSAYERAFLEGYFEQKPIPYQEIRLYEMLSLLDKWSSVITYYRRRGGKFKDFGALKAMMTNQYFKRSAKRLLKEITGSESR
jgi:Ser/Thr protein kinase RdoA (MazF antagonist)